MASATLFIPDISGFTRFVKTTEQEHSRHIIGDLVKLIIRAGKKKFDVAEIEGDAVFFFKDNKKYGVGEIQKISSEIYGLFHDHLKQYEHKRICECGACTTAANLELKFVVHYGEISLLDYGNNSGKPFGQSVIEVHRLLKNKIGHQEYVLFSEAFLGVEKLPGSNYGTYMDKELGVIPYWYHLIEGWKESFEVSRSNGQDLKADLHIQKEYDIDLPPKLLHEMLINFKYRQLWNKGVDKIIYNEETINQVGTAHYCVIKGRELSFDTKKPLVVDGELAYGEILKTPAPFKYFESDFYLTKGKKNEHTRLRIALKVKYKSKFQRVFAPAFKYILNRKAVQSGQAITGAVPKFLKLKDQQN